MQTQAFRQVTRTHTRRLQALQQPQGDREMMDQLLHLRLIAAGESLGERGQRVFQITIVIERLDQKLQGGAVLGTQAQGQRLRVQVALQRHLGARQLGHIGVVIAVEVVAAGFGVTAPLAVIGRHGGAAVALPTLRIVRRERRNI